MFPLALNTEEWQGPAMPSATNGKKKWSAWESSGLTEFPGGYREHEEET